MNFETEINECWIDLFYSLMQQQQLTWYIEVTYMYDATVIHA